MIINKAMVITAAMILAGSGSAAAGDDLDMLT
jgi:hypothetical protein